MSIVFHALQDPEEQVMKEVTDGRNLTTPQVRSSAVKVITDASLSGLDDVYGDTGT